MLHMILCTSKNCSPEAAVLHGKSVTGSIRPVSPSSAAELMGDLGKGQEDDCGQERRHSTSLTLLIFVVFFRDARVTDRVPKTLIHEPYSQHCIKDKRGQVFADDALAIYKVDRCK